MKNTMIQSDLSTILGIDLIEDGFRDLLLKEKLHKTDWLIDQIVYRLYGLTEEEIKIVEGQAN